MHYKQTSNMNSLFYITNHNKTDTISMPRELNGKHAMTVGATKLEKLWVVVGIYSGRGYLLDGPIDTNKGSPEFMPQFLCRRLGDFFVKCMVDLLTEEEASDPVN